MTDKPEEAEEQAAAPEQTGHKNPPVGPKTGNVVPDWNKFRDYEQFMPGPNL
jgi:hypothetical protein